MAAEKPSREEIRQSGWSQGAALPKELVVQFQADGSLPKGFDFFILVSHNCDILNPAETFVEVIGVKEVAKDGSFFYGKNPRRYQIASGPNAIELDIRSTTKVDWSLLASYKADDSFALADQEVERVSRWIANRYLRAAFPDTFNERVRPALGKVRRVLKQDGELLTALYLIVSDRELDEAEDYHIILRATMRDEEFDDAGSQTNAALMVARLEDSLTELPGIVVEEAEVLPERDVSLSDLRRLKRWDFDDLSLRAEDFTAADFPPEG